MKLTRRLFLKIAALMGMFAYELKKKARAFAAENTSYEVSSTNQDTTTESEKRLGADADGHSTVYLSAQKSPEENMRKVIALMGGIETIVGQFDIVVLKPNAQWWNQGMTNTNAMQAFIQLVLDIPGFEGEIIIAENHHERGLDNLGWTTQKKNGDYNYNELIAYFNDTGHKNITKYHWQDAGPNPWPLMGGDCCGNRISGPEEGDGYVWCEDIQYVAPNGHVCWMTYPVFTSTYSGIRVDLKNGAWKDGRYRPERPVKFINFSALNHHGFYSGATGCIKNLMGVVDMTCGLQGTEPKGTFNVHFVGVESYVRLNHWLRRDWGLGFAKDWVRKTSYKNFHFTGGALGKFMSSIRMPDLHVITAEWVGWGSRIDTQKSARPRAIATGKDPVALDLIAAKKFLYDFTPPAEAFYRKCNDPEDRNGPFHKFVNECHRQGIGNILTDKIKIVT